MRRQLRHLWGLLGGPVAGLILLSSSIAATSAYEMGLRFSLVLCSGMTVACLSFIAGWYANDGEKEERRDRNA